MMRCWLKPCPRCRAEYLIEVKQNGERAVVCLACGYHLLPDEMRFLVEDVVFEMTADREKVAV